MAEFGNKRVFYIQLIVMKKIFAIIGIASLAFTSCTKDDTANDFSKQTIIKATFEQDASSSRLNIATNNALTWSTGDAFALFGEGSSAKFTLQGDGGSATGEFAGTAPATILGAAFPYTSEYNPSFSGSTLSITLPAELDQSANGKCNLPMWAATSSVDNISFKHLAGVLRINLNDAPVGYNSLTVTASAPIAGPFTADTSADVPVLEASQDATNALTVSFAAATADANDNVLYIPLPVGTYSSLNVTISNGTGVKELITYNNKTVERAKIYTASLTYSSVVGSIATEVSSGEELAEVLASGGSAVLTDDVDVATINIPVGKNSTIDLNGYKITSSAPQVRAGESATVHAFVIKKGASLTIGGDGEVVATAGSVFRNYGGSLTINGGKYENKNVSDWGLIYCDGAKGSIEGNVDSDWHLTINGGTFVSEKSSCISLQNNYYGLGENKGSAKLNAGTFTGVANTEARYDLYVACAEVDVDFDNCTFTNGRIYINPEISQNCYAPVYINGTEYTDKCLYTFSNQF